jgi:hypothetical protein
VHAKHLMFKKNTDFIFHIIKCATATQCDFEDDTNIEYAEEQPKQLSSVYEELEAAIEELKTAVLQQKKQHENHQQEKT